MFEQIKNKIAEHKTLKLCRNNSKTKRFNGFISKAETFLILIPNTLEPHKILKIIEYLNIAQKQIYIFSTIEFYNSVFHQLKTHLVDYAEEDKNSFKLPNEALSNRLKKMEFDVVVDLHPEESMFFSAAANIVHSNFRIGFQKKNGDHFYNVQLEVTEPKSDEIYQKMLAVLRMF